MRQFYTLIFALFLSGLGFAQSDIRVRTEGGTNTEDIWVTITTGVNGTGSEVWTQKTATCAGLGLIDMTNQIPAGTYYVNCHDQKGDGWTQTNIDVFAYNLVLGYASSPNDGMDTDATDSCDNTADEIEASFEIIVPEPISCPIVLSLDTDDVTDTKAILNWTNGGSETQWEYVVQPAGTGEPTSNGTVITANPYIITGLSPFTSYEVYLRADCAGGDYSAWVGPESFTTTASPVNSFPYNEDFESGNGGWSNTDSFASENWELGTPSGTIDATADGQNAWYINSSSSSVDNAYVLSPPLNFSSLDAPIIEFPLWSDCMFSVDGMALQSSVDDGATWQTVGGFNEPISGISNWYNDDTIDEQPGDQSLGWTGDSQDGWGGYVIAKNYLSGLAGESEVYLRFVFSGQGEMAFDAIQIYNAPCNPITGLTVDTISDTTATISWVVGGFESQWEVAIQSPGTGLPSAGTSVTTNPYTATGLNPSTAYEVYVRADCGMDGTSDWVGPVSFSTNSIIIYSEQFIGQNDKGAVGPTPTVDLTGVDWNIDITSTNLTTSTDWFRVENEIFEARDIDGVGIWLSPSIDISLYTDVSFSLDASERGTMENSDIFETEYRLDGGPWTSASINGILNGNFTNATVSQSMLNGNTLEIRVRMNNGADVEVHELDNILVEANSSVIAGPTIGFNNATSTENETDASFSTIIPVTMTNYDSPVTVSVTVSGAGTTEVGDYTLNTTSLDFTANETLNILLDINDDVDFDDETVILDIAVTSGTADLEISQHTVTITDDEIAEVIITEIMQNPGGVGDSEGEYFEVYNPTDSAIDMNGWTLSDAGSDSHIISSSVIVPSLGFAVLSINADLGLNGGVTVDYEYSSFNLANGDDEIILTDENANEVDRVDYDGGTLWPDPNGAAMIYIGNDIEDNNDGALWVEATIAEGLDVDFGSPGTNGTGQIVNFLVFKDGSWNTEPTPSTGTRNAIIENGEYVLTSDVSLNDVSVHPGAAITVPSGITLTALTLDLESNSQRFASLIVDGTLAGNITNNVTYRRFVNPTNFSTSGGNDLISPPVTLLDFGEFIDDFENSFGPNPEDHVIYNNGGDPILTYAFAPFDNQFSGAYDNYEVDTQDPGGTDDYGIELLPYKGYRVATNFASVVAFRGGVNSGTVNTTDFDDYGNDSPDIGIWNLVGNPYPSYLDAQELLTVNAGVIDANFNAVYGYNDSTDGSATGIWTIINDVHNTDINIAPGQGFFVPSNGTGQLTYTPAMRTTTGTDDFIQGRQTNTNAIHHMTLELSKTDAGFITDFYFTEAASLGLDPGYDAGLFGGTAPAFALYSHLVSENQGTPMAIQSLGGTDYNDVVIPLGVHAPQGEQLTFTIAYSDLPPGIEVYLEDKVTNTFTLLNTGDYTLTPNTDLNGTGRFFLHFSSALLSNPETAMNTVQIYTPRQTQSVVIAGHLNAKTTVEMYDLQGRLVLSELLNPNVTVHSLDVSDLISGVYVIKLHNPTLEKRQKVILK